MPTTHPHSTSDRFLLFCHSALPLLFPPLQRTHAASHALRVLLRVQRASHLCIRKDHTRARAHLRISPVTSAAPLFVYSLACLFGLVFDRCFCAPTGHLTSLGVLALVSPSTWTHSASSKRTPMQRLRVVLGRAASLPSDAVRCARTPSAATARGTGQGHRVTAK
jgi:hypothetical protein